MRTIRHPLSGVVKQADPILCLLIGWNELHLPFPQAAAALKEEASVPAEELTQ
jgi:hypothetical protein